MSPQSELDFMGMERSVPLFSSPGGSGEGFFIAGAAWAFVFRIISFTVGMRFDILLWLIMTLAFGAAIYLAWYILIRHRFRNPVTDQEMIRLFEEVKRDLGRGENIQLWYRDIDRQVFLSASNVVYRAILLSESAIADILSKREKARVMLAKEVLQLEKRKPYVIFLTNLLGFTFFAFLESLFFFDFTELLIFSLGTSLIAIVFVVIIVFFIVVPIIQTRVKKDSIDETVERIYGVPPDAARMEVLAGLEITDEMIRKVEEEGEEDLKTHRKDALKKSAIMAVIGVVIGFFIFYAIWSSAHSVFVIEFSLLMSIVIGGGAFVITYMTALMWPMMTAGSRPRSTEWDAESPFAGKLEEFLHEEEGYERLTVKGIKSPFDGSVGLAILGLKPNFTEATLHAVLPHTLKELNDIELIGPLILAELKIDEAKARERKIGYRVLAIAVPFLAIGMAWMFLTREIDDAVIGLFQVFIVYLIIAFIPMGYMVYWRRKELKRVELEIAMKYPRYREALQILVNKHHTLPYGTTSYRARLKHINEALGLDTYRPPDDDGLGLE